MFVKDNFYNGSTLDIFVNDKFQVVNSSIFLLNDNFPIQTCYHKIPAKKV